MSGVEDSVEALIAGKAGEWFVANDEAPLDAPGAQALAAWLKSSPVHVEKFLGVSVVALDLRQAAADPAYSLEAMLAIARTEDDVSVSLRRPGVVAAVRSASPRRRLTAAAALAASAVLAVGMLAFWGARPVAPSTTTDAVAATQFATRHGQQLEQRLGDGSVMHLNSDTAVTLRYGKAQRIAVLTSGQAEFEVAHETERPFRVVAGSAEIVDLGTRFDVRLDRGSTVVTVVEGRVVVQPSPPFEGPAGNSGEEGPPRVVRLRADQQLTVTAGRWQAGPITVDAKKTTAWLHRQIVFEQEPLERVAAEFNRYAQKPFEITTPALRSLKISGVFTADDSEAFLAFLRSLDGVRVEVGTDRIRVLRD